MVCHWSSFDVSIVLSVVLAPFSLFVYGVGLFSHGFVYGVGLVSFQLSMVLSWFFHCFVYGCWLVFHGFVCDVSLVCPLRCLMYWLCVWLFCLWAWLCFHCFVLLFLSTVLACFYCLALFYTRTNTQNQRLHNGKQDKTMKEQDAIIKTTPKS